MARSKKAEADYEARAARPGVQLSLRLSDEDVAMIDDRRGAAGRASWIKALIAKERRASRRR